MKIPKVFILDVDGVLTTGQFFYSEEGKIMKIFGPDDNDGLSLLKPFIDLFEGVDFITTMGAGCHAHPKGTQAGARALVQSCEAFQKGISIEEYAKTHKELKEAIEFFTKNKKKVQEEDSEKS